MSPQERYNQRMQASGASRVNYQARTQRKLPAAPRQQFEDTKVLKAGQPFRSSPVLADTRSNFQKLADLSLQGSRTVGNIIAKEYKDAGEALSGFAGRKADMEASSQITTQATKDIEIAHTAYKAGRLTKDEYGDIIRQAGQTIQQGVDRADQALGDDFTLKRYMTATISVALTPLAFGKLTGLSTAFKAGQIASGPTGKLVGAISKLDDALAKIPSLKNAFVARPTVDKGVAGLMTTGKLSMSQIGINQAAKDVLSGALIKYPFNIAFTVEEMADVWDAATDKKYGEAAARTALLGTMYFQGGPFGAFMAGGKKLGKGAKIALYGEKSFTSELFSKTKDGVAGLLRHMDDLAKTNPKAYKELTLLLKQSETWNVKKFGDGIDGAAGVRAYYKMEYGIDVKKWTSRELVEDMLKHYQATKFIQTEALEKGFVKGISAIDAKNYTAVRFDKEIKGVMLSELGKAKNKAERLALIQHHASKFAFGNNQKFMELLASKAGNKKELIKAIKNVKVSNLVDEAEWTKGGLKMLDELGYLPAKVFNNKTVINSAEELAGKIKIAGLPEIGGKLVDDFQDTIRPFPVLSTVGSALQKAGLSPQDVGTQTYRRITTNFTEALAELNIPIFTKVDGKVAVGGRFIKSEGDYVMGRLQQYVESRARVSRLGRPPVQDVRFLRVKEIVEAMAQGGIKISEKEARAIRGAILQSYLKVPLQLRGLGDKIVDSVMSAPGLGTPYRAYLRTVGQLRYAYNPFFYTQEQVETIALTGAASLRVNKTNRVAARKALEEAGFFRAEMGTRGFGSFATDDLTFGAITANLSNMQKDALAAMAYRMAKKQNKSVAYMLANKPDQISDALKVVVQYKSTGPLNSPLARTLNLAVFPSRYNAKVAGIAANAMSKLSPPVQLAVINSAFEMQDWIKSDEGIRWQSQYADVIGFLGWVTPVGSLQWGWNLLFNRDAIGAPGDLGQLGGIPFGFITQILENQGLITINTPYVNPKTGEAYLDRIPVTSRGKLQAALTDLISSTFSYPGRTIGLPGKGQLVRGVTGAIVPTTRADFDYELAEEQITDYDRRVIEVLNSGEIVEHQIIYRQPPIGYAMPAVITRPISPKEIERRKGLPSKTNARKQTGTYLPDGTRRVISRIKFDQ